VFLFIVHVFHLSWECHNTKLSITFATLITAGGSVSNNVHELDPNTNINSQPTDTKISEPRPGGNSEVVIMSEEDRTTSFFAQPGILAGKLNCYSLHEEYPLNRNICVLLLQLSLVAPLSAYCVPYSWSCSLSTACGKRMKDPMRWTSQSVRLPTILMRKMRIIVNSTPEIMAQRAGIKLIESMRSSRSNWSRRGSHWSGVMTTAIDNFGCDVRLILVNKLSSIHCAILPS